MKPGGKQTALMPGNEDKVGVWLTPPDLMAQLQAEFDFDFDAAPYPRPAGFDGIKEPWGKRTWCNPPFGAKMSILPWARKAAQEARDGKMVVLIGPIYSWTEPLLDAGADVRFVGRLSWRRPDGKAAKGSSQPSALFILRPKP